MNKLKFNLLLLLLFFSTNIFSQNNSVGAGIGFGSFWGNFKPQSTLNTKLFYEFSSLFEPFDRFKINLNYAQHIDKFLPGNENFDYFPYYFSFGLTGDFKQYLNKSIFINEGLGFIILNDRSFNDINTWNLGIKIEFQAGTELTKNLDLAFNLDYGLTLTNTRSGYTQFTLNLIYNLFSDKK